MASKLQLSSPDFLLSKHIQCRQHQVGEFIGSNMPKWLRAATAQGGGQGSHQQPH